MKRIWDRMIAMLCTAALLLALAGCAPEKEKTASIINEGNKTYRSEVFRYDVGELYDITPVEDGYLLCTEQGAASLKEDFSFDGFSAEPAVPIAAAAQGSVYATLSEDTSQYFIFRDREEAFRTDVAVFQPLQLFAWGNSIWACDGRNVWRNGTAIGLPQTPGTFWKASAIVGTATGLFTILTEWQPEADGPEQARIVELGESGTALDEKTGLALPAELFDAQPVCAQGDCVYSAGRLWKTDGQSFTLVADLQQCGVNPAKLRRVLVLEDGRILCLQQDCLIVLSAKPAGSTQQADGTQASSEAQVSEPPAERVTLRLGTLYSAFEFSDMISYVNLHSAACSLEVKEYKSMDQLNRALLSGEVDILGLPDLSALKNYAAKGLLTPMETVAPTLFSSGVLYENMVEALRVDGSCCCLPLVLQPQVNAVPKRYQAAASDLAAPQAYFSFLAENEPEAFGLDTREIRFSNWLTATADYWIDAEAGTTHFQTEEFLALLEYCDRFVLTPAEAMANQGAAEGTPMASCNQPMYLGMHLWEDYDLVPPPFAGVSACTLHSNTYLAVVSGCDLEAAKALMMTLFTDAGWHETWKSSEMTRLCISINREWAEGDLDAEVAQMLDDPYTEIQDQEGFLSGVAHMKALYAEANHFAGGISELNNVILEEAQVYFNGDCTAQQAAERIENRVWLYINEHN